MIEKDIPYGSHPRQKLDLYLPSGHFDKMLFYVHGGSWSAGDKGDYHEFMSCLSSELNVGVAVTNYRLTPDIKHPGHVEDCADALAWVLKNVNDRVYLIGHSSGGHLTALLGTDEHYLLDRGYNFDNILGNVCVSGIYLINYNVNCVGLGDVFKSKDKHLASPINHISPRCPKFLLYYATDEFMTLSQQAVRFHKALCKGGARSELRQVKADHVDIVYRIMWGEANRRAFLNFVGTEAKSEVFAFTK